MIKFISISAFVVTALALSGCNVPVVPIVDNGQAASADEIRIASSAVESVTGAWAAPAI